MQVNADQQQIGGEHYTSKRIQYYIPAKEQK